MGDGKWRDFSEELPPRGRPVLCKSRNGIYFVGEPVALNGEVTDSVWVPKGGRYRLPAKWREIDDD